MTSEHRQPHPGHEPDEIRPRRVLYFAAALVLLIAAAIALLLATHELVARVWQPTQPTISRDLISKGPALNPDQLAELDRLRAREDRELRAYGWVDASAGVARVPIERAMAILAQRGIDAVPAEEHKP